MTKAQLQKEIEGMKSTLLLMESRIEELEAHPHPNPLPDGEGINEATDDDLFYILRTKGREAYHEALKARNKQRAVRWGLNKRLKRAA